MPRGLGVPARGGRWWRALAALALVLGLLAGALGAPGGAGATPPAGGQAYAWGSDGSGELGDGPPNAKRSTPVGVVGMADAVAVAVGVSHSLVLTAAGRVYASGYNGQGQLGDGNAGPNVRQFAPVPVALPAGVSAVAVAAGDNHSLALTAGGRVYAWGYNQFGQLGDGTSGVGADKSTPVPVALPPGVTATAVAAGGNHSLALTSDGRAYAWGWDVYGQLGDGNSGPNVQQPTPVPVALPPGVTIVAVAAAESHSLAVTSDGRIYAWGYDGFGQLGDGPGDSTTGTPVPVALPAGVSAVAVSAGYNHSLALTAGGQVYAWGWDAQGQLGDGAPNADQAAPVGVAGLADAVAIAAGGGHSLALTAGGQAYAWGSDQYGQLGDGNSGPGTNQPAPVAVALPGGLAAVAIAAGSGDSLAVLAPRTATTASGAGTAGGALTLTAVVTRQADGAPVPAGGQVTFTLAGQTYAATTDAQGVATVTAPLPAGIQPGSYPGVVGASYAGAVGYAPSQGRGTLAVAPGCAARFADVRDTDPACGAIYALADRGIIAGYATAPPTFGPEKPVQRAEVAAFLVRALGWQYRQQLPRDFPDLGDLQGTDLPSAVRIAANACTAQGRCVASGFGDGTFGPTKMVTKAEVIAFLARAFGLDPKYAWADQPNGPQPYNGVPAVHETAIRTYTFYAGAIPDAPTSADGWNEPASRAWVARVLYQALMTKP